jgi:general secretion pathway protein H
MSPVMPSGERRPQLHAVRTGRNRPLATGFTLIEILVVLVIIGIIVSFALLSFGVLGKDSQVEEESRRLVAILTEARDEAALQGRDLGLRLEPASYEFMSLEPRRGGWETITDDDLLRRRDLPEGITMRLWLESREVILERPRKEDRKEIETPAPQVIVLGSGEIVPFDLEIAREGGGTRWHVAGTVDGKLVAEDADAPP